MVEEMPVGKTLKQRTKRYSIKYDSDTTVFRILDLWHPSLETVGLDSEIGDSSEALTVLPYMAFEALLEEADRLGLLSKYISTSSIPASSSNPINKSNKETPVKVQLAKMGIEAILKLVGVAEIDEMLKEYKEK